MTGHDIGHDMSLPGKALPEPTSLFSLCCNAGGINLFVFQLHTTHRLTRGDISHTALAKDPAQPQDTLYTPQPPAGGGDLRSDPRILGFQVNFER